MCCWVECVFCSVGWNTLYITIKSICSRVWYASLLISFYSWSVCAGGIWGLSHCVVYLMFKIKYCCFMMLDALVYVVCMLITMTSCCWIVPITMTFLAYFDNILLEVHFVRICAVYSACFVVPIAQDTLFFILWFLVHEFVFGWNMFPVYSVQLSFAFQSILSVSLYWGI